MIHHGPKTKEPRQGARGGAALILSLADLESRSMETKWIENQKRMYDSWEN